MSAYAIYIHLVLNIYIYIYIIEVDISPSKGPYSPFKGTVYAQALIVVAFIVVTLFSVFNFTRNGSLRV